MFFVFCFFFSEKKTLLKISSTALKRLTHLRGRCSLKECRRMRSRISPIKVRMRTANNQRMLSVFLPHSRLSDHPSNKSISIEITMTRVTKIVVLSICSNIYIYTYMLERRSRWDDFQEKGFIGQGISSKTVARSISRSSAYKLPWIRASSRSTRKTQLSFSSLFWLIFTKHDHLFFFLSHCWRRSFACSIVIQAGYSRNLNGLARYTKWPSMCK